MQSSALQFWTFIVLYTKFYLILYLLQIRILRSFVNWEPDKNTRENGISCIGWNFNYLLNIKTLTFKYMNEAVTISFLSLQKKWIMMVICIIHENLTISHTWEIVKETVKYEYNLHSEAFVQ